MKTKGKEEKSRNKIVNKSVIIIMCIVRVKSNKCHKAMDDIIF